MTKPNSSTPRATKTKLALGTVQLGMRYGAANTTGKPSAKLAEEILRRAASAGVDTFDTARAYGDAEELVGAALGEQAVTIVTKLDPLEGVSEKQVRAAVDASVNASREKLRRKRLDAVLLHDWGLRKKFGGAVWERLLELKKEHAIGALGASLGSPPEAEEAMRDPAVERIQIPFNALDWRWKEAGLHKNPRQGLVIDARSALLQGLLAAGPEIWKKVRGGDDGWIAKLEGLANDLGRESRADLCFAYVRAQSWIERVVVGVETMAQLEDALRLFARPALTVGECGKVERELEGATEDLLDPWRWKK